MFLSAENDNEFSPSLSLSLLFLFFCSLNYDPAIRRKKYHLTTATLLVTINPLEPAKLFKRSGTLPSFPFPFFSPPLPSLDIASFRSFHRLLLDTPLSPP